jgi:hypothetical protein
MERNQFGRPRSIPDNDAVESAGGSVRRIATTQSHHTIV